jgi:hypothetical protein
VGTLVGDAYYGQVLILILRPINLYCYIDRFDLYELAFNVNIAPGFRISTFVRTRAIDARRCVLVFSHLHVN